MKQITEPRIQSTYTQTKFSGEDVKRKISEFEREYETAMRVYRKAVSKREMELAKHDEAVRSAALIVERCIVGMAKELGVPLTASILSLPASEVKRLVRTASESTKE